MSTGLTPAKRRAEALGLLESPQISALFDKVRLASDPPVESPSPPRRPNPLPAAIWIGLLCTAAWWCFGGLRSGALRASLPLGHAANSAVGDSCLYRGDFYPSSGIQTLRQIDALKNGASDPATALASRGIAYAVLANWFTVGLDAYYAPLALNLVLCWVCAWLVMRATGALFQDRTKSVFAATCFSLSIVATASVGEIGPRMLGLSFCFLWTLLLVAKDADDTPFGWRGSLGMAALMGLWSLVDATALTGLVIYAAFALKQRKPGPLVMAAVAWCLVPLMQELLWRQLGFAVDANPELARIGTALQLHGSRLAADPLGYLGYLTIELGNLIFAENPVVVVIGLVGLGLISHRSKWLLRICFLAPILMQLILLPTTRDRGCAMAGGAVALFALVAHYAVEAGRRFETRFGAEAFAVPLVALAIVQGTWGYAGLVGWDFPANAFANGAFREAGSVEQTKFARFSGSPQEVPTVLRGPVRGPWFFGPSKDQTRPSVLPPTRLAPYANNWSELPALRRLWAVQAPALVALLIATLCVPRIGRGLALVGLFAGCTVAAALCGSSSGFLGKAFATFDQRITIQPDEKLVGTVRLSPEFQAKLEEAASRGAEIELFVRARAVNAAAEHPAEFQVAEWSSPQPRFVIPAAEFVEAVRARNGRLEFSLAPTSAAKGLLLHSWQATRMSGERTAQMIRADGVQVALDRFPSFEIRILRSPRAFAFQRLIERFEPSQSTSYALIGF